MDKQQIMMSPLYWLAVGLYLILTPIQEFVARCCLQAPLQAFLPGTDFKRCLWAILVSNLVFAAAHSHISLAFALAAFIPGIFWGWIFARTNSLLAAAISHFLIGGAGIFLFGIEEFIATLVDSAMAQGSQLALAAPFPPRGAPSRMGSIEIASPVASSTSIRAPQIVAGPTAGENRLDGMRAVNLCSGSPLSMPMMEL